MHDLKPDDLLSRFLFKRKYINFEKGIPNTSVFTEKHPNGFSVFNVTDMSGADIWDIADRYVAPHNKDPLLARCDLQTRYYEQANLAIKKSEPPPRHYNIHGLPVGTDLDEAKKLSLRQVMVANSRLYLYSDPLATY